MLLDLNDLEQDSVIRADLCIIGSGAAGLAIAKEFMNSRFRVIILEGGGQHFDVRSQSIYQCEIEGLPFVGATEGRYRVFGGSTTAWGGQCIRYSKIDFEKRGYVSNSGWPIGFGELTGYYERAETFLGLDDLNYEDDIFRLLKMNKLDFSGATLAHSFSKWSPQPDIRKSYLDNIKTSTNLTVLLNAHAVGLELNDAGDTVSRVPAKSLEGKGVTISCCLVVLCAGGIENARILLYSNRRFPQGIGNDEDLVGRYFQDHPATQIGTLAPRNKAVRYYLATRIKTKTKYTSRFTLADAAQRQYGVLAASGNVSMFPDQIFEDIKSIWMAVGKRQIDAQLFAKLFAGVLQPELYEIAFNFLARGIIIHPRGDIGLNVLMEQEPNRESRIKLSDKCDVLALPVGVVQWKLTELNGKTLQVYSRLLKNEIERLGLGMVILSPWVTGGGEEWTAHVADQAHHIGTTRMHDSPKQGVVDRNCRVHTARNLYISGSSVFPTGGHSSPTLTLVALSIRLADHLHVRLSDMGHAA